LPLEPYRSRKFGFDLRHVLLDRRARALLDEIVAAWRPDAIYERYSLYCRAGQVAARKYALPRLLEVNALLTREQHNRIRLPWLARRVERGVIAGARHVIVVSRPLAEEVTQLGVPAERISRMPMAVNLEQFNPEIDGAPVRAHYGLDGRFVIGYVGTLAGWHGIRLLYDMAQELRRREAPPFAFLIVGGEGDKLEANRRKTREAGLEGILHFIGSVVHDVVPEHIRAFDAAIVPDTTYWSSPAKLFEYQACAVPVLAPSYPAILSAMTDGGEGFIYPPEDVGAMADAALKLMADPAIRAEMGAAARRRAASEHSWQSNAEAIVALFEGMKQPAAV
jgi:glycosyltransferase involved in cell wall biosynthesis